MSQRKLPSEWCNAKLGDIVHYGKTQKCVLSDVSDSTWVLELEDVEKESSRVLARKTVSERPFKSTKNIFKKGDVLYGKLRPYLNKVVLADEQGVCTTEIIPLDAEPFVLNRYLFYWLKSHDFLSYVSKVSYGVNMPRLGTKDGVAAPIVLAPLAEQKVIADKLDTLLAQVDNTKARLERIPAILKRFRQSVLAAAVSGRLTKEWRSTDQNIGITDTYSVPSDWAPVKLDELSSFVTSGSRGWAKYYSDEGSLFIRSQDINTDKLDISDPCYVSLPNNIEGQRTKVQENDLLLTITGANVTKCARVKDPIDNAFVSQHVSLIRLKDPSIACFIELVLKAPNAGRYQLLKAAYGGGKPGLNLQNIKNVSLALPESDEMATAIRRVDQLFAHADRIERQVDQALARVNNLTQSILAKAFRGELTEQWRKDNPELISGKNSAEALLERIKTEQIAVKQTRGRG